MQVHRRSTDGTKPPGTQTGHHQRGVAHRRAETDQRTDNRDDHSFFESHPAQCPGGEPDRRHQAQLPGPLFDVESEEHRDEQHGGHDQKEAEGDE